MEQTVSSSLLAHKYKTVLTVFFFITLFLPLTGSAQTTDTLVEYDYTKEMSDLNNNYDQILDYQDSKRCIAYSDKEKLNCTTYEDTITYLYKTQTPAPTTVIDKNTLKQDEHTFQIFSSDVFYQDEQTNTWKQTDHGIIEKNDFQAVQDYELKTIDEISFLNNPFKIYKVNAQIWGHAEDGRINNYPGSTTWSVMRDATTGTSVVAGNAGGGLGTSKNSSGYYQGIRHYFPFSTSGIDDCVASSTFSFYTGSVINQDNDGNDFITLIDNSAGITLETTDWDATTFTEYIDSATRLDYGSAANKRVAMKLNATATSTILDDEYFYLMMIEGHDFLNDPYGGGNNTYNDVIIYHAEDPGLTRDPYLLVTTEECPVSCGDTICNGTETCADCEEDCGACGSTATTSIIAELPLLPLIDDLTIITGLTEHYETNTTTPDWIEYQYYRIPAILYWILSTFFLFILGFILSQIQRILRKKK